jgi:hypothetical protein
MCGCRLQAAELTIRRPLRGIKRVTEGHRALNSLSLLWLATCERRIVGLVPGMVAQYVGKSCIQVQAALDGSKHLLVRIS